EADGAALAARQFKRHQVAATAHLPVDELGLWMVGLPGVDYARNRAVSGQIIGDPSRARTMGPDPQLQGFQTLEQHPGIERAQGWPGMAQEGRQLLSDESFGTEDDAAKAAPLSVDMLGRRVDDDIGTQRERPLQDRRGEDVVDDEARAGLVPELGDGGDVDDLERRV